MEEHEYTEDEQRIADYYNQLVDRYGYDPRASDAWDLASLRVRYAVLASATDLTGKSVLNVGCAFGDFGVFLKEKFSGVTYIGIDIARRMVEEGRKLHPDLPLRHQNVLDVSDTEQFDAVLTEGVFYRLGNNAEPKMRNLIEKMFNLSRETLAFSTLSSWSPRKIDGLFYADPVTLLDWCQQLTRHIVVRHDYFPHDFAFYMHKKQVKPEYSL